MNILVTNLQISKAIVNFVRELILVANFLEKNVRHYIFTFK